MFGRKAGPEELLKGVFDDFPFEFGEHFQFEILEGNPFRF
jgi:hypothetical protein